MENVQLQVNELNRKIEALRLTDVQVEWNEEFKNFRILINGKISFIGMSRDLSEAFILGVYMAR